MQICHSGLKESGDWKIRVGFQIGFRIKNGTIWYLLESFQYENSI